MINYLEYFGITANYTIAKLKKAYLEKINSITKLNISDIDKYFFIEQTRILYKQAKNDYKYNNSNIFAKVFDNNSLRSNNSNYSSYSNFRSYSAKSNNDGSKTINETIKTNKNGVEQNKSYTYKKYPDGRIEKINNKLLK